MNGDMRALLDDAVSGLEPSNPDPVPSIVRRGRAARRRTVLASTLSAVALLAGTVVAGEHLAGRGGLVPDDPAQAPTPRLVGHTIVAGNLAVPVPKGWRVVVAKAHAPCDQLSNTVLISAPDVDTCQHAPIEVAGTRNTAPVGAMTLPTSPPMSGAVVEPVAPYTLRGGEPAWASYPIGSHGRTAVPNRVLVPWSKVLITLWMHDPHQQQQVLDSVHALRARQAEPLVLPQSAGRAEMLVIVKSTRTPNADDAEYKDPVLDDSQAVDRVLRLLAGQTATVDSQHACNDPEQPTVNLRLREASSPVPVPSGPDGASHTVGNADTVVTITVGSCHEAVSSAGGRVRLSEAAITELMGLFGIHTWVGRP